MNSETTDARRVVLHAVVRCLAHVIYWSIRISLLLGGILLALMFAAVIITLIYQGCVWMWQHWKQACVIALVAISVSTIIALYEWSKIKLGKNT